MGNVDPVHNLYDFLNQASHSRGYYWRGRVYFFSSSSDPTRPEFSEKDMVPLNPKTGLPCDMSQAEHIFNMICGPILTWYEIILRRR